MRIVLIKERWPIQTHAQLQRPAPMSPAAPPRVTSEELLQASRVVEIEHEGRIYALRVTRSNKQMLTA